MTKDYLNSLLNPQFISKPGKEKSMKCIKRGTVPSERIWQGECYNCNSVFEAKEGELEKIIIDPRENARMSKALCEVCNNYFWLYPK